MIVLQVLESRKGMSVSGFLMAAIILFMIVMIYPLAEHVITETESGLEMTDDATVGLYILNFKTVLAGFLLIVFLILFVSAKSRGYSRINI